MKAISFTCEIVTPMFLSGADGYSPERRFNSLKNVLMFWWRAMQSNPDIAYLRKKESEIFGDGGGNASKSKLLLQVSEKNVRILKNNNILERETFPGIAYLFYSVLFVNTRDCFKPDSTFKITFKSPSDDVMVEAIKAFACQIFFGGLGSRTRRGAGSLFVKGIEGDIKVFEKELQVFSTHEIGTAQTLKSHIEKYLRPFVNHSQVACTYSTLNDAQLRILEPVDDWKKSLEKIGILFKQKRDNLRPQLGKTPNFGLPIAHRRRAPNLMMISGSIEEGKLVKFSDRRSSPVIIKTIKTGEKLYFPIALHLKGDLLPSGIQILDETLGTWQENGITVCSCLPDTNYVNNEFLSKINGAVSLKM